jgi:G patch domain-containing protein 1
VGAFEAEDDDIYAREDMSRYDFALGSQRKSKSRWSKNEAAKVNCLEGFVSGKDQHPAHKIFEPPELPKDFQPVHKVRKSRFSPLVQEGQVSRKRCCKIILYVTVYPICQLFRQIA